ncbi:MAG: cation diffusion facilitator family transporter [Candidatus Rokuibacteriota bacterium]
MSHPGTGGKTTRTGAHARRLAWTLGLTGGFLLVEVAGALWTGSLALLADAGHMLTDAGGLALALFAVWLASKPPTAAKTYGYYRAEILAALANAVVLLVISAFILYEAYRRFLTPADVLAGPMLAVAVGGLVVNLAAMRLLHAGAEESLNVKGAYLEVLSDALASLGVIIAAGVVLATGWRLADPIVGAAIGLFIIPRTWALLRQAVDVLLESTPAHINLTDVEQAMQTVSGVRQVHDLHVWTLTSGKYAMSGHVLVDDLIASDRILRALHALLHERFDIDHTTIQPESEPLVQIAARPREPASSPLAPDHDGPHPRRR